MRSLGRASIRSLADFSALNAAEVVRIGRCNARVAARVASNAQKLSVLRLHVTRNDAAEGANAGWKLQSGSLTGLTFVVDSADNQDMAQAMFRPNASPLPKACCARPTLLPSHL